MLKFKMSHINVFWIKVRIIEQLDLLFGSCSPVCISACIVLIFVSFKHLYSVNYMITASLYIYFYGFRGKRFSYY